MDNLKTKKVLVYDYGLCIELAVKLAKSFGKVYYFSPWEGSFPKSNLALIGEGMEGLERIKDFWDYVDQVDLVCFFDSHCSDDVDYLRGKGYRVWGAGKAEFLENDRWKMRKLQKAVGLPTQDTKLIHGIENLIDYLKRNKDCWVKINTYRGDMETFYHKEYDSTQAQFLGELLVSMGAKSKYMDFIIEQNIDGIEVGYDGFVIDGEYPDLAMYGMECKDNAYLGKITPYKDLPAPIKEVNDKMKLIFKKMPEKTFFSTEVRMTKGGKGYLIDPTIRVPLPPLDVEMAIFDNIADFIWEGANGHMIPLKPVAKYGAEMFVYSDWADEHWTEVKFDPKDREAIMLRSSCKIDDKYYILPEVSKGYILSIVGLGNNPKEAIDKIKKVVEKVEAKQMTYMISSLDEVYDKMTREAKSYGITF